MMHEIEVKGKKVPLVSESYYCKVCKECFMTSKQLDSLRSIIPIEEEE
jgi:hypothetical protein